MTMRTILGLAQRLLAGVVLVVSGAYLLIYLYRWEWNRAIISGLFFLSAEVALASAMILRRLRVLENRVAPPPEPSRAVFERLRSTPVERPNPFGWLDQRGHTQVFVPVLLGAGAILSAVAYVVERVAEATAVPALDRHLANGLICGTPTTPQERDEPSRTMTMTSTLLALVAIGLVGWLGIHALLDATQSRPDVTDRPARTTIDLSIAQRSAPDQSAAAAAEALWIACRSTVGSLAQLPPSSRSAATTSRLSSRPASAVSVNVVSQAVSPTSRSTTSRQMCSAW
jgi:hypothetical protein